MATNGLVVMTPTSIAYSGTSASINGDGSVSYSACTALYINGVFTNDFDNYLVVGQHFGSISTGARFEARLTVGGVAQGGGTSDYVDQYLDASSTTVAGGRASGSTIRFFNQILTQPSGDSVYLFGPYLAQATAFRSVSIYGRDGGRIIDSAGTYSQSTQCDGFYLTASSGNVTGLLTVFGFNQ